MGELATEGRQDFFGHAPNVVHGGVVAEGAFVEVGQGRGAGFVEGRTQAKHEGGYAKFDEILEALAHLVRIAHQDVLLGFSDGDAGATGVDAEGRGDSSGVFADEEVHVEGKGDFAWVSASFAAVVMEDLEFASVVFGGAGDVPVPVVGDSRHEGEGELLAGAADEDGRVRLLDGLGLEGGVTELVAPTVGSQPDPQSRGGG